MRAIELPHAATTGKSTTKTASERSQFRWQVAATVSFLLNAIMFVVGSAVSALAALSYLPSRPSTAYLTVCLLVGSLAFVFLGAHAMDKIDNLNG